MLAKIILDEKYIFQYFSLEEIALLEYFCLKYVESKSEEFSVSTATISDVLGIKRSRSESIIKKFVRTKLIKVSVKGFPKVKYIEVNAERYKTISPLIYGKQ